MKNKLELQNEAWSGLFESISHPVSAFVKVIESVNLIKQKQRQIAILEVKQFWIGATFSEKQRLNNLKNWLNEK